MPSSRACRTRTATFSAWAPASRRSICATRPSVASITAKVAARAAGQAAGRWVVGRGWDQNDWPRERLAHAQDLDAVAADTPVVLKRIDGHAAWANSKALALAGITAATPGIPMAAGCCVTPAGRPTGVLIDTAQRLVERAHSPADRQARSTSRFLPPIARRGGWA